MDTSASPQSLGSPNHQMSPRGSPQAVSTGNHNHGDEQREDEKRQITNPIAAGSTIRTSLTSSISELNISQETTPSNMQSTTELISTNQTTKQLQKESDKPTYFKTNTTQKVINRTVNLS